KLYSIKFDIANPVWYSRPSFFDPYYEEYSHTEYLSNFLPALDGDYKPEVLFECEPENVWKEAKKHADTYWNDAWCDIEGNDLHEDADIYDWEPIEVRVLEEFYDDGEPCEYYEWHDGTTWVPFEW
ncbi:MAG: hypothetical protein IKB96_04895, partial [Prevotella sp.]|nr:hypothetical protein [Prevotella sp.]